MGTADRCHRFLENYFRLSYPIFKTNPTVDSVDCCLPWRRHGGIRWCPWQPEALLIHQNGCFLVCLAMSTPHKAWLKTGMFQQNSDVNVMSLAAKMGAPTISNSLGAAPSKVLMLHPLYHQPDMRVAGRLVRLGLSAAQLGSPLIYGFFGDNAIRASIFLDGWVRSMRSSVVFTENKTVHFSQSSLG